jgi:catechol 2,3-dioxygenase-like lactoylglutathione lyase family enzyme
LAASEGHEAGCSVSLTLSLVTLVVPDYDQAIAFYRDVLGFTLAEDTDMGGGKRWVRVMPSGGGNFGIKTGFLLAKAIGDAQIAAIGNQAGGRVAFFLQTTNFARDYAAFVAKGVQFLGEPRHERYGSVAVFQDPFGNRFDLIEMKKVQI